MLESIEETEKEKLPESKNSKLIPRDINLGEVYEEISKIGVIPREIIDIVTCIIASHALQINPPLWLMIIGVPSSFKTELVKLFELDEVYTLDTLTENSFASGYVEKGTKKTFDLLPNLNDKCLIIKDLTTLFSLNDETVKKILGDLTSIFDGEYRKYTGNRGLIEHYSLFSFMGCITPSILNKHTRYVHQLGPRFLYLRLPELTQEDMEKAKSIAWNLKDRGNKIKEVRLIVSSFANQFIKKLKNEVLPEITDIALREKVFAMAEFIAVTRGIVIIKGSSFENENKEKRNYYEVIDRQIEQPWRIFNQLKSLSQILALLHGNNEVTETDITTLKLVISSSMPIPRAEIINSIGLSEGLTKKEIADSIGKSIKTVERGAKELIALGILDSYQKDANSAKHFFIIEKHRPIIEFLQDSEFVSNSESISSVQ